ncbi:hypothetical protein ACHWQZ_G014519 [Mnemiopsis leidyi]
MNCTCYPAQAGCTCAQWAVYLQATRQLQSRCTCNLWNQNYFPPPPLDRYNFYPPYPTFTPNFTTPPQKRTPRRNKRSKSKLSNISEDSEVEHTSTDDHMAEELAKFFQQTSDHRVKMKEERKNLSRVQLEKVNFDMNDHIDRAGKLSKLYGAHYVDIASLEAKLSLQYETYCDENQPVLWPVLPLKL